MTELERANTWYLGLHVEGQNVNVRNALFLVKERYALEIKQVNDASHYENMVGKVDAITARPSSLSPSDLAYYRTKVPNCMFHDTDSDGCQGIIKYPSIIDPRGVIVVSRDAERLMKYKEQNPGVNLLSANATIDEAYGFILDIVKNLGYKLRVNHEYTPVSRVNGWDSEFQADLANTLKENALNDPKALQFREDPNSVDESFEAEFSVSEVGGVDKALDIANDYLKKQKDLEVVVDRFKARLVN